MLEIADDVIDIDVDGILTVDEIFGNALGDCTAELVDVGVPTNVVVIVGILSSAGELELDSAFGKRFKTSTINSSKCAIR